MSTKAELIARIAAEATIVSERLVDDYDQIRTYVITHKRTRGVNAEGRTITLWVYDEGGAAEEALMDYGQWLDVPLSVRLAEYIETLPNTVNVRNIAYLSVYTVRFTEVTNTGIKAEKIGIWNELTDKLDVYESTKEYPPAASSLTDEPAFSQGARENSISFNPQNQKHRAIKVPMFDSKLIEYPQNINLIDVENDEIVLPADMLIAVAHFSISMSVGDTTNNDGTNFHFQWQVDGNWIGSEFSTGFIKQESSSMSTSISSFLIDQDDKQEHRYSYWCWCTDRQGPITIQDCSCVVIERKVQGEIFISPSHYVF